MFSRGIDPQPLSRWNCSSQSSWRMAVLRTSPAHVAKPEMAYSNLLDCRDRRLVGFEPGRRHWDNESLGSGSLSPF